MIKNINTLIIDDHPLIREGYKNALNYLSVSDNELHFNIFESANCAGAYENILKFKDSLDLIFLDINLPKSIKHNIQSGEDLGKIIREKLPSAKIIVATSHNDSLKLKSILKNVNPHGLLVKIDFGLNEFIYAIKSVLNNKTHYSHTVLRLLQKKQSIESFLDDLDIKILIEISNASTTKEIIECVPLSKSGIEKRKRKLKVFFNVASNTDRYLILAAREKGFL